MASSGSAKPAGSIDEPRRIRRRALLTRTTASVVGAVLASAVRAWGQPESNAVANAVDSPSLPSRLRGAQLAEYWRWSPHADPGKSALRDLPVLKEWGVNVVRLCIRPYGVNRAGSLTDHLLAHYEQYIAAVVDWCSNNGIWVVLVIYPEHVDAVNGVRPAWPAAPSTQPTGGLAPLWNDAPSQDELVAAWQALARHFRTKPQVLFDLLNEPNPPGLKTAQAWNALYPRLVASIRAVDPDRWLVVESADWANPEGLERLAILPDDRRILYSFHCYRPHTFTFQGTPGHPEAGTVRYPSRPGEPYPANPGEQPRPWNKAALAATLQPALAFQQRTKARLLVGEAGASNQAPAPDRARWLRDALELFEEHGLDWIAYCYHSHTGAGSFATLEGTTMEPVLREYLARNNIADVPHP